MRRRGRFGPLAAVIVSVLLNSLVVVAPAANATTASPRVVAAGAKRPTAKSAAAPSATASSWCTTSPVSGWPLTCPIEGPSVEASPSQTAAHGELPRLCDTDKSVRLPTSAPLPPGDGSTTELPPAFTFQGLAANDNKTPLGEATDSSGAVGRNHYVQTINNVAAVYNKLGQRLCPPFHTGTWWGPNSPTTGGAQWDDPASPGAAACSDIGNVTDAIVMYDTAADRWFASHFVGGSDGATFWQCFAVSRSDDPTGSYALYAFRTFPFSERVKDLGSGFADYPKFGIWPNEYIMTTRYRCDADPERGIGAGMIAFDRQKMLADVPDASAVIFFQPYPINDGAPKPCDQGYTPALQSTRSSVDVDGAAAPPPGTPAYFLHFVTPGETGCDSAAPLLRLDTLTVDWSNPSEAHYVDGAAQLPVDGWPTADSITTPTGSIPTACFAMMNRSVYRNFGDHESIVANHSVGTTSSSAPEIRWVDLRRQTSGPWQFAQPPGNFELASGSNDPVGIGLGSIAMDHLGNIALGYVFANHDVPQSAGAAARLSTDGASSLPRVGVLQPGSPTNKEPSLHVDYTQMTVDPVDDCTFWYVGSFAPSPPDSGSNPFRTSISAFKLPGCGTPSAVSVAPTFTG